MAAYGRVVHSLSAADLLRRSQLRRMQRLATGLFVVVTMLFVAWRWYERDHHWAGYPRAFLEAAMVGALADWFAVTALFRHPLGLRIPHTAIVPHRKDQIGRSLGEFVETNFLTHEVLGERLASADVAGRAGRWLARPENTARASAALADALRGGMEVLDDREVSHALEALIERRIRETPVAPIAGRIIGLAIEGGHHQRLLDAVLTGLDGFLADNRVLFRQRLEHESPWWIPESIDDRIFEKIYTAVQRFLSDVGADHHHEVRASIDRRVADFAVRLSNDPELLAKGERLKADLLDHPDVRAWLRSLWGELKRTTTAAANDPGSELRTRIAESLQHLGQRLLDDAGMRAKLDEWVMRAVGYVVDNYRSEVADTISATVARWDADATAERMELQVGRDLQFIRINGTLVGGLAGLMIYTASQLLF
jgi:uncharacterized membrane-anchored protein YjiN (DUF445 family)